MPRPLGSGRAKGTPNKKTAAFADALKLAYARIGGDKAFATWARANPDQFYAGLMAKLLPHELAISGEIEFSADPLNLFETARRIAFVMAAGQQQLPAAERVESLPSPPTERVDLPPIAEEIPAEKYPAKSEPFEAPTDVEEVHWNSSEQGISDPFSQHPRIRTRPVIRRRRDLL